MKIEVVTPQERTFTITLTERELGVLRSVADRIGGPPEGPRGVFDRLAEQAGSYQVASQGLIDYSRNSNTIIFAGW